MPPYEISGNGMPTTLRSQGQWLDIIKTEHLYMMDGRPAYSLGQGE